MTMTAHTRLYLMCSSLWNGPTYLQSLNQHWIGQLYDALSQKLGFRCVTLWKTDCYACIEIRLPYGCTLDLISDYGFKLARRYSKSLPMDSFVYEAYDFPSTF